MVAIPPRNVIYNEVAGSVPVSEIDLIASMRAIDNPMQHVVSLQVHSRSVALQLC